MHAMFGGADNLSDGNKCAIHLSFLSNDVWPYDWEESCQNNYSLSFGGDGDYTHLDWSENLSVYTVSVWVKPNSLNQNRWRSYFNTYSVSSNGFQLDASGNDEFRFASYNNTTIIAPMTLEWSHIAVRSDGQRTTLYLSLIHI